jgi:hypothetical protein
MSNGSNTLQPDSRTSETLSDLALDVAQPEVQTLREKVIDVDVSVAQASEESRSVEVNSQPVEATEVLDLSTSCLNRTSLGAPLRMSTAETRRALLEARLERLKARPYFAAQVKAQTKARSKQQAHTTIGILKNPFYKYRGGIFGRIITFLANVLKCLEVLLLRRVSRSSTNQSKTQRVIVVNTPPPAEAPEAKKEALRLKEKKRVVLPSRSSR